MDRGLGIRTPDQGTDCPEMILDLARPQDGGGQGREKLEIRVS